MPPSSLATSALPVSFQEHEDSKWGHLTAAVMVVGGGAFQTASVSSWGHVAGLCAFVALLWNAFAGRGPSGTRQVVFLEGGVETWEV